MESEESSSTWSMILSLEGVVGVLRTDIDCGHWASAERMAIEVQFRLDDLRRVLSSLAESGDD